MEPKAHLHFKTLHIVAIGLLLGGGMCCVASCKNNTPVNSSANINAVEIRVDTTHIPRDTVNAGEVQRTRDGIVWRGGRVFSGYLVTRYPGGRVRAIASVYNGMAHGITRSFYENGQLRDVRQYQENLSTGRHYGYWPNGKQQFDYVYYRDRKVGYMKRWYESGNPYLFLHYNNDNEEGLQQGWRENGKLFLNYVVKNGFRYGLQETMLCYKLNEGNIIQ